MATPTFFPGASATTPVTSMPKPSVFDTAGGIRTEGEGGATPPAKDALLRFSSVLWPLPSELLSLDAGEGETDSSKVDDAETETLRPCLAFCAHMGWAGDSEHAFFFHIQQDHGPGF